MSDLWRHSFPWFSDRGRCSFALIHCLARRQPSGLCSQFKVDYVFSSDACLTGCGAVCSDQFFHREFPQFLKTDKINIVHLECVTIVAATELWCTKWKGCKISIFCDNEAVCSVINSGKARDKYLLRCMRDLAFLCCTMEFEIRAVHLSSSANRLADLLSWWHLDHGNAQRFLDESGLKIDQEITVEDTAFVLNDIW